MRQRFFDLIDQNQAQVAWLERFERRVDGQELAVDLLDFLGALGVGQAQLQQRQHFAVGAAALALILIEQDLIEGVAENFGLLADVLRAGRRRR